MIIVGNPQTIRVDVVHVSDQRIDAMQQAHSARSLSLLLYNIKPKGRSIAWGLRPMISSHDHHVDNPESSGASTPSVPQKQHYRILLIEDSADDAFRLRESLIRSTYATFEITHVESLNDAFLQVEAGQFDVALLSLLLPDSMGLPTLTALRKAAPRLPVVVLATLDSEAVAISALQTGAQDYFVEDHGSGGVLAHTVRLAYERAKGQESLRFMTEAGAILASSLDYEDTLQQIANLTVPFMADCCIIDIAAENGSVELAHVHHTVPHKDEILRALGAKQPVNLPARHPVAAVIKSGEARLYSHLTQPFSKVSTYTGADPTRLHDLGFTSGMILPLRVPSGTVGTLSLFLSEREHRYNPEDLALAEELALRSALAVDNARLYGQAQVLARAREEILSAVSHDLRTPLTAARAGLGLLEMRIRGRLADDEIKLVGHIQTSIERLSILVDDLLTYNEIEAGILQLNREQTDLRALITTAISTLHPLLEKKGQTLDVDVPAPLVCSCDPKRVGHVIINLLDNAHRHTPSGTPITISGKTTPEGVHLVISDYGPGIDKSRHDLIFKRFHRIASAKSGLGLGLAMARGVIQMHGGRIWVESATGHGAAFHIELPYLVDEELEAETADR
jgi:signal transduction histidine kinase/DNA-binding NarL/FixJ family response regulator